MQRWPELNLLMKASSGASTTSGAVPDGVRDSFTPSVAATKFPAGLWRVGIARRPRAWVLELLCGVGKVAWSGRTDSPSNRPRHVACDRPASVRSETSHHLCLGSRGAG